MKQPQRGVAKRAENKQKRQQQLIQDACEIISQEGPRSFTLAALAAKTGVSIPTVHNLLGKKSDVFTQVVECMVNTTSAMLAHIDMQEPIAFLENLTDKLISLYQSNESLYKAAFVISESEHLFEHEIPTKLYEKSLAIALKVIEQAIETGQLKGQVNSHLMAKLLFANQRLVRRDWMHGHIDLPAYKRQILSAIYVTLAADACPQLHQILIAKIHAIQE